MSKEVKTVSAKEANAQSVTTTSSSKFYAFDNEGQIHWGSTKDEALRAATAANQDLRENH